MSWRARAVRCVHLSARVLMAVPGGYLIAAQVVSVAGWPLAASGLSASDAVVLASMLGFILSLVWLLWVLATRRLRWVLCVMVTSWCACEWMIRSRLVPE